MGRVLFDTMPVDIRGYHQRTKHAASRYALGPAFLDWESQPNGFRRFDGARLVPLPLRLGAERAAEPLNLASLGLFLELALGISAWKEVPGALWPLRNTPSSGNLHPTEGWVILPPLAGIGTAPALYHYSPLVHGLEERCRLVDLPADLPAGGFLFALSSVLWRECWKYGERAFRYCQHDAGHALAAAIFAAACVGWHVRVLAQPGDAALAGLLGLDRDDAAHAYEREHPDLIALVAPTPPKEVALRPVAGDWFGRANCLSDDHDPWPVVDLAARVTHRADGAGAGGLAVAAADPGGVSPVPSTAPTAAIIRRRRSAQQMQKGSGLGLAAFADMLTACLPAGNPLLWRGWPWAPRLALMIFVHQVDGLAPGLYALIRDDDSLERLRAALKPDFLWQKVAGLDLPLYALALGEMRREASLLSCQQAIAGHSAFSLGMLADFDRTLGEAGDWAYRRLHWEAGMIGQALYLAATSAGQSGTGIGCFFDDGVHDFLGLGGAGMAWQTLYHFTIGTALEDERVTTLPAYPDRVIEA